jgi:hypothetical protein
MAGPRSLRHWTYASALLCACSLTESLDELSANASGGVGGTAGQTSSSGGLAGAAAGAGGAGAGGGAGGSLPDAGAGASGAGGGGAGGGGAGAGGDSGSGTGGVSGSGGGAAASGGTGGAVAKEPVWWQTSWPKRVQLTVANSADVSLPSGFELGFPINPSAVFGSALTTFQVVRWSSAGWTVRPHHVEQAGGTTFVWTPLATSIAAGEVDTSSWLYAGNPNGSAGNPAAVFTFWDGFDGVSGEWFLFGTPVFQGGTMMLTNKSSVRSSTKVPVSHAVDYRMVVDQDVSPQWEWICGGFQRLDDFDNVDPWFLWISRSAGTLQGEAKTSTFSLGTPAYPLTIGESRLYSVERYASKTLFRRDGQVVSTLTSPAPYSANMQMRFSAQSDGGKATFDFVRMRRAADPAPVVSFGSVESEP